MADKGTRDRSTGPGVAFDAQGDMFLRQGVGGVIGERGRPQSTSYNIPAGGELIRLDDIPCQFAMLSCWNVNNSAAENYQTLSAEALYENAGLEIYYGFGERVAHQLFPTQTTAIYPVSNLNQIIARMQMGSATAGILYVTYWE